MGLINRLERLERQGGAVEDCPLCASRAAKADEPDNGLCVFESLAIRAECPRCGRPFTTRIDLVERAAIVEGGVGR
jgi:transcriptional regulator NrdR family protein